jgi:hypothetical protein
MHASLTMHHDIHIHIFSIVGRSILGKLESFEVRHFFID